MDRALHREKILGDGFFARGLHEFRPKRFDVGRYIGQLLCQLEPSIQVDATISTATFLISDRSSIPDVQNLKLPSGFHITQECSDLSAFLALLSSSKRVDTGYLLLLSSAHPPSPSRMIKRMAQSFQMATTLSRVPAETLEYCQPEWLHSMRQAEQAMVLMEKPGRFLGLEVLRRTERQWQGGFRLDASALQKPGLSLPQVKSGFCFGLLPLRLDPKLQIIEQTFWLQSRAKSFSGLSEMLKTALDNFSATKTSVPAQFSEVWLSCPDSLLASLLASVIRYSGYCHKDAKFFYPAAYFGWHPCADFVQCYQRGKQPLLYLSYDGRHEFKLVLLQER